MPGPEPPTGARALLNAALNPTQARPFEPLPRTGWSRRGRCALMSRGFNAALPQATCRNGRILVVVVPLLHAGSLSTLCAGARTAPWWEQARHARPRATPPGGNSPRRRRSCACTAPSLVSDLAGTGRSGSFQAQRPSRTCFARAKPARCTGRSSPYSPTWRNVGILCGCLYVIAPAQRARQAPDAVSGCLERLAEFATSLGKTRTFHSAGAAAPPGLADLEGNVWRGDRVSEQRKRGFVGLGVPIGHAAFVEARADKRLRSKNALLLLHPRSYYMRGGTTKMTKRRLKGASALLPASIGGLRLLAGERVAPAAYWAAWADALAALTRRHGTVCAGA